MKRKWMTCTAAALVSIVLLSGAAVFAAPGRAADQTEAIRFLFQLPPEGGEITLSDDEREWTFFDDGVYAVIEAMPGDYILRCGDRTASLRLTDEPEVLGGEAAWDGEILHMGVCGTLELVCNPRPGEQLHINITAADGVHTRTAAYDPVLAGQAVAHCLDLPAGTVTVTCDGFSQSVTLHPGETRSVNVG